MLAFKKASAKTTYEIKKAKKDAWKMCLETLNNRTSINDFWRKINAMNGKISSFGIKHMIDSTNNGIVDGKAIAEELAKHYHQVSSTDDYCLKFRVNRNEKEKKEIKCDNLKFNSQINTDFTFDEYQSAFKTAKSLSSGPDGVPYLVYNKLCKSSKFKY